MIGRGPEEERLRGLLPRTRRSSPTSATPSCAGPTRTAPRCIAPAIEDFGLTPLEVGAFGKPTLALRGGGYLDTVADGVSGHFFDRPEAAEIAAAVRRSLATNWDAADIREHGRHFDEAHFRVDDRRGRRSPGLRV